MQSQDVERVKDIFQALNPAWPKAGFNNSQWEEPTNPCDQVDMKEILPDTLYHRHLGCFQFLTIYISEHHTDHHTLVKAAVDV